MIDDEGRCRIVGDQLRVLAVSNGNIFTQAYASVRIGFAHFCVVCLRVCVMTNCFLQVPKLTTACPLSCASTYSKCSTTSSILCTMLRRCGCGCKRRQ